jgi:hypothetical protein
MLGSNHVSHKNVAQIWMDGLDVTQHGEEASCDQWEPIDEWRLVSRMPRYTASDAAMTAVR